MKAYLYIDGKQDVDAQLTALISTTVQKNWQVVGVIDCADNHFVGAISTDSETSRVNCYMNLRAVSVEKKEAIQKISDQLIVDKDEIYVHEENIDSTTHNGRGAPFLKWLLS